jgi:hypothetical protein
LTALRNGGMLADERHFFFAQPAYRNHPATQRTANEFQTCTKGKMAMKTNIALRQQPAVAPVIARRFSLRFLAILALWTFAGHCSLGANFQNLNFEQAQIQSSNPPAIDAAAALPHWTSYLNGTAVTSIYNVPNYPLDDTSIALVPPGSLFPAPIEGNYSVQLYATAITLPHEAAIAQTGFIPTGMRSIQLLVRRSIGRDPEITVNGTPIGLVPESLVNGVTTFGGDITPFAGTTPELRIQAAAVPGSLMDINSFETLFELDSISFSTAIVPEPSAAILVLMAAPLLLFISSSYKTNFKTSAASTTPATASTNGHQTL